MRTLAGKPLVEYTLRAALSAKLLDDLVLSTDDPNAANLAEGLGITTITRPPELATDDTPIAEVVRHALEQMSVQNPEHGVVLLQPTSPLRGPSAIDSAIELFLSREAETLVSVTRVPHRFNPESLMRSNDLGELTPVTDINTTLRRQDKPSFLARNGPAILITKVRTILRGVLYGSPLVGMFMPWQYSIDIDREDDLSLAEALLEARPDWYLE